VSWPVGLALAAAGLLYEAQLPVGGHYFWNIFPAFLLGGIGLGAHVRADVDRGSAGGRTGGCRRRLGASEHGPADRRRDRRRSGDDHRHDVHRTLAGEPSASNALAPAALTHGFQIAFYVLAAVTVAAALVAGIFIEIAEDGDRDRDAEAAGYVDLVPVAEQAA